MNIRNLLSLLAGVLAGFSIGFILANSLNREQRPAATTQTRANTASANAPEAKQASQGLSEKEIREAIATTDARATDTDLQKRFGLALYRYSNQQRDTRFLTDAARFLKRAHEADPKDHTVAVSLGNALFDLGQLGDAARFAEARIYYQKALEIKPDDANVRTDLGLTYYYGTPQDLESAIREYRRSLAIDPRHEPTLQNLATALIKTGNQKEAQKTIEALRQVNPKNPALPDLEALLAQESMTKSR